MWSRPSLSSQHIACLSTYATVNTCPPPPPTDGLSFNTGTANQPKALEVTNKRQTHCIYPSHLSGSPSNHLPTPPMYSMPHLPSTDRLCPHTLMKPLPIYKRKEENWKCNWNMQQEEKPSGRAMGAAARQRAQTPSDSFMMTESESAARANVVWKGNSCYKMRSITRTDVRPHTEA